MSFMIAKKFIVINITSNNTTHHWLWLFSDLPAVSMWWPFRNVPPKLPGDCGSRHNLTHSLHVGTHFELTCIPFAFLQLNSVSCPIWPSIRFASNLLKNRSGH